MTRRGVVPPTAPRSENARKALIRVGYACNNHCVFCHTCDRRGQQDTAEAVDTKIERAGQLGHTMVVLSGGEPTLRPELPRWAERARRSGLGLGLVTNGRMLAYSRLADELVRLGLGYAHLSLHGPRAAVHDSLVRAEAFEQTLSAIRNLRERDVELTVASVVTRANVAHLPQVVDLLAAIGGVNLKFAFPEPKGAVVQSFDAVVPPLAEAAGGVAAALAHGLTRGSGLALSHEGFPLCLLPGFEDHATDLRAHGFISGSEVGEADFYPIDTLGRTYPPPCDGCGTRGRCPGVYRGYWERRPDVALTPRQQARSNSFNYRPVRTLRWPSAQVCPLLEDGVTPYDRARALFVRSGEEMALYETRTRDHADDEIRLAKLERGQVYLDRGGQPTTEDFSSELAQLERIETCQRCPQLDRCASCYAPSEVDVFDRDDAWVRARLADLVGDVLEVGCGRGRYLDALAARAQAGQLRYTGVDPDDAALGELRARFPWAETRVAPVDQLPLQPASLDHILLLHSYNHLPDIDSVLARLVDALRPDGTLLVADDVAFGLVRSAEQVVRAEAGPGGFEHFRTDDAARAEARFEQLPVRVLARRDVSRGTSNQWALHLGRKP